MSRGLRRLLLVALLISYGTLFYYYEKARQFRPPFQFATSPSPAPSPSRTVVIAVDPSQGGVPSQPISTPHVTLDLIAENTSIAPARDFWVGLLFKLEKGWHVYWINPGDSGEPPKVQWSLPPGFQAGGIAWPYPQRLMNPPLMDYGYENQVLLPIRMSSTRVLKSGDTVRLTAAVRWLVCRELCIPEKAEVKLTIPVMNGDPGRAAPLSMDYRLFAEARSHLPHPAPGQWKVFALSVKDGFVLVVQAGRPLKKVQFLPTEPLQIENAAPQKMETDPRGIRLTLRKSEQLLKPPARLTGLLVVPGDKAYLIDAPVTQGPIDK